MKFRLSILFAGLLLAGIAFYLAVQRAPHGDATNAVLQTSNDGYELIKGREDLRLDAYQGPSGKWTIGWGHTKSAKPGQSISRRDALRLLKEDVKYIEGHVRRMLKVSVNQNEFDALVSFAFNIGITRFRRSSVLRELNAGNRTKAADAFLLWTKIRINGELTESDYLKRHRVLERDLFLQPL